MGTTSVSKQYIRKGSDLPDYIRFVNQIETIAETCEADFLICFSGSEAGAVLGYQHSDLGLSTADIAKHAQFDFVQNI